MRQIAVNLAQLQEQGLIIQVLAPPVLKVGKQQMELASRHVSTKTHINMKLWLTVVRQGSVPIILINLLPAKLFFIGAMFVTVVINLSIITVTALSMIIV